MTPPGGLLVGYFDEAADLFDRAVRRVGPGPGRRLAIAGQIVDVRLAGHALGGILLPALAHQPDAGRTPPDLVVRAWDLQSTGTTLPPPPWAALAHHERGNVRAYDDERFSLNYDRRTDVFSAVDAARGVAIYWTRSAGALPNYTSAAPMHRLLQGWFRGRGLFMLHAAAVGRPDAGLLLAGRSGSGKSTTAVLALGSDLLYAGDDYALVQCDPAPYVHSLYNTSKVNRATLARTPELGPAVSNPDRPDGEKALIFFGSSAPRVLARGFPLHAIVLPRVTGERESVVAPASPLAAYRAVGPDTAFTMLGDSRALLGALSRLVHRLPCYRLGLGTDRDGVRAALEAVLNGA